MCGLDDGNLVSGCHSFGLEAEMLVSVWKVRFIYHHCSLCAARGINLGRFGDDGIERHGNNVESGTTEPRPE